MMTSISRAVRPSQAMHARRLLMFRVCRLYLITFQKLERHVRALYTHMARLLGAWLGVSGSWVVTWGGRFCQRISWSGRARQTRMSNRHVINCRTSSQSGLHCTASLSELGSNARISVCYASHWQRATAATRQRHRVDKVRCRSPVNGRVEWTCSTRTSGRPDGRPGPLLAVIRDSGGGNASCRVCYCLDWFAGVSEKPERRQRLGEAWTGCIRHVNTTSRHLTADRVRSIRRVAVLHPSVLVIITTVSHLNEISSIFTTRDVAAG